MIQFTYPVLNQQQYKRLKRRQKWYKNEEPTIIHKCYNTNAVLDPASGAYLEYRAFIRTDKNQYGLNPLARN